ncbi:MAG: hypothetical protein QNI89_02390 [Desulfobacterales bacterium]|nr:hypothetical protein [Desulfobacterales bacterium]MDJ0854356.1 hypothetical protein [Desulfobacterales bacterium]MDJ0886116.1 hypothetical protein [Desulfobacterales bacterium]MDJ0990906.1 hypothetical protein [Desulfobacterales bacterium]
MNENHEGGKQTRYSVIVKGPPDRREYRSGLRFAAIEAPITDADKRKLLASPTVKINGQPHAVGYNLLMRSGDKIGSQTFGPIYDRKGNPVVARDGSTCISSDNDFSSLLPVGDKIYHVTHFESRPGAMYPTELKQDLQTDTDPCLDPEHRFFEIERSLGALRRKCNAMKRPFRQQGISTQRTFH